MEEEYEYYKFSKRQINNLTEFLNRIHDYKNGLQDVSNMNEILYGINNPIILPMVQNQNKDDKKEKTKKDTPLK